MKEKLFGIFFALCLTVSAYRSQGQKTYEQFSDLKDRLSKGNDTVYLINFWATWCQPCIEELPWFNELKTDEYKGKVKVLLVSLDFKKDLDKKLKPFIKDRKIIKEVVLLADADMNTWIPEINKNWDGNIPVTWIVQEGKNPEFINRAISGRSELHQLLNGFINQK